MGLHALTQSHPLLLLPGVTSHLVRVCLLVVRVQILILFPTTATRIASTRFRSTPKVVSVFLCMSHKPFREYLTRILTL